MCGGYNKDDGYRTACEGMARGAGTIRNKTFMLSN